MKQVCLAALFLCAATVAAQTPKLEKLWETDAVLAVPESVLPYDGGSKLYVSLIDGGGWNADGKGGIARMNADGSKLESSWITGLNAPKGMALVGRRLYVADIGELIVIDVKNGKIEKKIAIEGATGLNDVTADEKGIVYVSDSRAAKIWRVENDKPSLFLENVRGVNGVKAVGRDLLIGAGRSLQRAAVDKSLSTIAELPLGIDGIEPVGNGDFLVSGWQGQVFYVFANGRVEPLLDSRADKKNSADIGYDPRRKIVYVPTFNGMTVAAYKVVASGL